MEDICNCWYYSVIQLHMSSILKTFHFSCQHVFFSRGVQLSGRAFDCRSRGPWFNSEHPLILNFQLMTFLFKDSSSTTDQFWNMARTFICKNQQGEYGKNIYLLKSAGGIAQWQSIRLQIERSMVQLRVPPNYIFRY